MLINRNRLPIVNIFKHSDVMESYVSRNETNGILAEIESKLTTHKAMINDNFGFDYSTAPREAIRVVDKNVFSRHPLVDNIYGLNKRDDNSLNDPEILSFDRNNNIIGHIKSDNINDSENSTLFSNIKKTTAKITYGEKPSEDFTKFNPFVNMTPTDTVKIFMRDSVTYSIHRGGYIVICNTEIDSETVVNLISKDSMFDENFVKNDVFFNKTDLNNLVTNVDFNNDSSIVITTMGEAGGNVFIFDTINISFNKLNLALVDETIIEAKFIGNKIYFIITNNLFNYKIKVYNTFTDELTDLSITKDSTFFPNSIVKLGLGIYAFEFGNKFGKHLDNSIKFIKLNESGTSVIQTHTLPVNVKISAVNGLDENAIHFFIESPDILFNNSVVTLIDNQLYLLDKNICITNKAIRKVQSIGSNLVIASTDKEIIFLFPDNTISQFISVDILKLCENRNSGNYINDFSISPTGKLVVLFDDNTYRTIPVTSVKKKPLYVTDTKSVFSYIGNGGRKTIITNDKIYTITNGDISTMIITPHTALFDQSEYDKIVVFKYQQFTEDLTYVVFVTKTNVFTRFTMLTIEYTLGVPDISIITTSGISNGNIKFDPTLIREINSKILIPVLPNDSKLFLTVCDFEKSIIVKNYLQTTEIFSKALFINTISNRMSIGIGSTVYDCDLIDSLYDTPFQSNDSQDIDPSSIISVTGMEISVDSVTQNYAEISDSGVYNFNVHSFNNINANDISKYYKLGSYLAFISKKDVKVFDSSLTPKTICEFYDSEIINVEESVNELNIQTTKGNINLTSNNLSSEVIDTVIFKNKYLNHVSIDDGDFFVLNDNFTVSIIDNVNNKYYYDLLNKLTPEDLLLDDSIHTLKVDCAKKMGDYIFIGISMTNENKYYIGSFVVILNTITESVIFYSLVDHTNPVIDESTAKIKTNFIDMGLVDGKLNISYYFNSRVKCMIFDGIIKEHDYIIFSIPNDVSYIGMISTDSENSVKILTSNELIYDTDYSEKTLVYPSKVLLTKFFFVDVVDNKSKFRYLISETNLINHKSINASTGQVLKNISKVTPVSVFQYIQTNFKDLVLSTNIADCSIFHKTRKECMKLDSLGFYDYTNGYYLFNYTIFFDSFSNSFFNIFTNGFAAFTNLSGMSRINFQSNVKITTLGNRIIKDIESKEIIFELNKLSCIKNYNFNKIVNTIKGPGENDILFSADFFITQLISNDTESRYLNYYINTNNYTILYSDSKPIAARMSELQYFPTLAVGNKSYIYKEMENNTAVFLCKNNNATFGYSQCIFIDSANSYHTIDMIDGIEIKPIYVDNNGILHSIIRNGAVVLYMYGTDVVNSVIINNFENIIDCVKAPEIEHGILLVNDEGKTCIFDTSDHNGGLKYTTINFTSDDIIGIPTNYSFIRIVTLSDNFTANIIVMNEQTIKYNIIPDCRIKLTLDVFGLPFFEVDVTQIGILKCFYPDHMLTYNRYLLPNTNSNFGLSFYDCIKTNESIDYDINITVTVGTIPIDDNFTDMISSYSETFLTRDKSVQPTIFIRKNYFIVQYGKNISIFEIENLYTSNFVPLYTIKQNDNVVTKKLIDVGIGNINNLILTFSDKTARVIDIKKSVDENNEQKTIIDTNFHFYDEYKPLSYNDDIKWFITEIGTVGYISDNKCYIYSPLSGFKFIPTSRDYIKFFCVDPIYGRVYTVDDLDNFGYIDIDTKSYMPVKALTELDVKGIIFTAFNTVEILTTVGVFIYINDTLHKITNIVPDGNDLIIYPFKEYSV